MKLAWIWKENIFSSKYYCK